MLTHTHYWQATCAIKNSTLSFRVGVFKKICVWNQVALGVFLELKVHHFHFLEGSSAFPVQLFLVLGSQFMTQVQRGRRHEMSLSLHPLDTVAVWCSHPRLIQICIFFSRRLLTMQLSREKTGNTTGSPLIRIWKIQIPRKFKVTQKSHSCLCNANLLA